MRTRSFRWGMGIAALFLVLTFLLTGCHTDSSTREVRTVDTTPSATATSSTDTVVVERHVDHDDEPDGLFDIVGEILAFPFELIAGVFRFIF